MFVNFIIIKATANTNNYMLKQQIVNTNNATFLTLKHLCSTDGSV